MRSAACKQSGSVMTMKKSTGHPGVTARRSRADAR
jgi:hypothetical protein